jgi:predicted  nucleic acid-binding Zn-ribbon protein
MNATSKPTETKCPTCHRPPFPAEDKLRSELRSLGDELTRTRQRLETIKRAAESAEQQDADRRMVLKQAADNWEARARAAEKRGVARQAELDALRRSLENLIAMYTAEAAGRRARETALAKVQTCRACTYSGELDADRGEYCRHCGENVIAQIEAEAQAAAEAAAGAEP